MTEMIFITGRGKRAIEDHFDKATELEAELSPARQAAISCRSVQEILPKQRVLRLRAPAAGARARARRAVRAAGGRRRSVRGRARGRPDRREDAGARADGGGLRRAAGARSSRCRTSAREETRRYGIVRTEERVELAAPHRRHRGKTRARQGAVDARRRRPLHPHAAHLPPPAAPDARAPAARSS